MWHSHVDVAARRKRSAAPSEAHQLALNFQSDDRAQRLTRPEVTRLVPAEWKQEPILFIFIQTRFPRWALSAASDVPRLLFSLFSFLPSQLSFLLSTAAAFTPGSRE